MREALWLLASLLAAYAAFEFLRALRLPREGQAGASVATPSGMGAQGPVAAAADERKRDEDDDDFLAYAPLPSPSTASAPASLAPDASAPGASAALAEAEAAARFELELENSRLRQALQAQRDLVALQQTEIDRLVEDITALRDELDNQVSSVASSPEYSEAMVLAAQGLNAEMIAERCGITLAEAELVLALGRGGAGRP